MPAMQQVAVIGLPDAQKMLKVLLPREARNVSRRAVTRVAAILRDEARKRVRVDTGGLKRSIKSRRTRGTRDQAEAKLYMDRSGGRSGKGSRWHFIEYGTVDHKAYPFVRPAVESVRVRLEPLYRDVLGREIERELAKRAKLRKR